MQHPSTIASVSVVIVEAVHACAFVTCPTSDVGNSHQVASTPTRHACNYACAECMRVRSVQPDVTSSASADFFEVQGTSFHPPHSDF